MKNLVKNTVEIDGIRLCLFHVLGLDHCPLFGPYSVPIRSAIRSAIRSDSVPIRSRFGPGSVPSRLGLGPKGLASIRTEKKLTSAKNGFGPLAFRLIGDVGY